MTPGTLQTICQIIFAIGIIVTAFAGFGSHYYGQKAATFENKKLQEDLQKTIVNVYNSAAEDIDSTIKSFFQMPRYKTLIIKIGGTFRYEKSKVFLYSISPQLVDNRTVLILKVANEDSNRMYFLDEPNAIPLTIYLRIMNRQFLITVEGYDTNGIQVRTYVEKQAEAENKVKEPNKIT